MSIMSADRPVRSYQELTLPQKDGVELKCSDYLTIEVMPKLGTLGSHPVLRNAFTSLLATQTNRERKYYPPEE